MYIFVVIVHIIVALVLIFVVLLQSGKAGDLASAFGGAGSQTAFGARGAATVLTKATTISAILFMVTSLALSIMFTQRSADTVMETVPVAEEAVPVEPTAEPAAAPVEPAATPSEEPSESAPEGTPQQSP